MTKVAIVSDLHLEFRTIHEWYYLLNMINGADCDTVLIAGDIHPQDYCVRLFTDGINKSVVFIGGNHEYYHGILQDSSWIQSIKGGLKVVACTLWTDFKNGDPLVMQEFKSIMNDARLIKKSGQLSGHTLETQIYNIHLRHRELIAEKCPDIVMTHHAPSFQSVPRDFHYSFPANYFYCSDMEGFIEERPHIKLWIHGHTHSKRDYMIGDCRVVCNPLGYPHEQQVNNYKPMVIEL